MPDLIYKRIEVMATWQNLAILLVLFVLCFLAFRWRQNAIGINIKTFDARKWGYTVEEGRQLLEDLGKDGRRIYVITQLTLDVIFPFVLGGLIIILLFKLNHNPQYLLLIPLLYMAADLSENITTAYLAWSFDGNASSIIRIAAVFTVLKWAAILLSGLALLFSAGVFLYRTFEKQS
jgi:hypothetical protein